MNSPPWTRLSSRQHWRRGRYYGYPRCCIAFVVFVTLPLARLPGGMRILRWYRENVVFFARGYVPCPICLLRRRPFIDPCILQFYGRENQARLRERYRVGEALPPCDADGNAPPA